VCTPKEELKDSSETEGIGKRGRERNEYAKGGSGLSGYSRFKQGGGKAGARIRSCGESRDRGHSS